MNLKYDKDWCIYLEESLILSHKTYGSLRVCSQDIIPTANFLLQLMDFMEFDWKCSGGVIVTVTLNPMMPIIGNTLGPTYNEFSYYKHPPIMSKYLFSSVTMSTACNEHIFMN